MRAVVFTLAFSLVACQAKTPAGSGASALPITSVATPAPANATPTADSEQSKLIAQNPEGLRFRIRLVDGARFRQMERIRVELSFSSSAADTYKLDGGLYDRIGRMNIDEFKVRQARGR